MQCKTRNNKEGGMDVEDGGLICQITQMVSQDIHKMVQDIYHPDDMDAF